MHDRTHYSITNKGNGHYELLTNTSTSPDVLILDAIGLLRRLREVGFPEEQIKRIFLTLDRERFVSVPLPDARISL